MRALAALRMVWASAAWMAVEMLARTWCVRKLRGDARPSPYRVLSVAPGRRVWRAEEADSSQVKSAWVDQVKSAVHQTTQR